MRNSINHLKELNINIEEFLQQKENENKKKTKKDLFNKTVEKTIKAQFEKEDDLMMARVKE